MILLNKYRNSNISSGKKLADALNIKVYSPKTSPSLKNSKKADVIINWGLSAKPNWLNKPRYSNSTIINPFMAVRNSANKLLAFNIFEIANISTPPFTTSIDTAREWIENGGKVVCRTILNGSSGRGIVIAKRVEELVSSKLYTLYSPKKWEYRVHVVNSNPIHVQQKRRLTSEELEARGIVNRSKYIRNLSNGYIFSNQLDHNEESVVYITLTTLAVMAVQALGLSFGAVDMLVDSNGGVRVLEVNSAPGLEGTTLSKYIEAFQNII